MSRFTRPIFLFWLCSFFLSTQGQVRYQLTDPYSDIWATLDSTPQGISLQINYRNQELLAPSLIGLSWINEGGIRQQSRLGADTLSSMVDSTLYPPFYRKNIVRNFYRELTISVGESMELVCRAYAQGFAYRWQPKMKDSFLLVNERMDLRLPGALSLTTQPTYQPDSFDYSHPIYRLPIERWGEEGAAPLASMPLLVSYSKGSSMLLGTADLKSHPQPYFAIDPDSISRLRAKFPYDMPPMQASARVAASGPMTQTLAADEGLPWRVFIIAEKESELLDQDLIYLLNPIPDQNRDYSWIKRGQAIWPGGNGHQLVGVDFRTGINQDTYLSYLEFAASQGIGGIVIDSAYVIDEWNTFQPHPNLDIEALSARAREYGLDVWVSLSAAHIMDQPSVVLSNLSYLGAAGIWIQGLYGQSPQSRRQIMQVIELAYQQKLMLMLDDGAIPDGMNRRYPHVLSLGYNRHLVDQRWGNSGGVGTDEQLMQAMLRMPFGPMIQMPTAMEHASRADLSPRPDRPASAGTRCQQMAQAVIYDLPLILWAGLPQQYLQEPMILNFYRNLPQQWDRVIVQDGILGALAVVAKRQGETWYVAAMNGWEPRSVELDLGFLPEGRYQGTLFMDGVNADRRGEEYRVRTRPVDQGRNPVVNLVSGGGAVMVIKPIK
ncbi:MAG: glycoside hydrolase family 97 catalytic domain-containing protein [Bacteroidota bacterium]